MRQYGRADQNHLQIVNALRGHPGVRVQSLSSIGGGCPALVCGYRGRNHLIEVKAGRGHLTAHQRAWHNVWTGSPVIILRNTDDVVAFLTNADAADRHGIVPGRLPT